MGRISRSSGGDLYLSWKSNTNSGYVPNKMCTRLLFNSETPGAGPPQGSQGPGMGLHSWEMSSPPSPSGGGDPRRAGWLGDLPPPRSKRSRLCTHFSQNSNILSNIQTAFFFLDQKCQIHCQALPKMVNCQKGKEFMSQATRPLNVGISPRGGDYI